MRSMMVGAVLALFIMAVGAATAEAGGTHRHVVYDARDNIVHDARGNCVFTKWVAESNQCGEPEKVKRTYTRPYLVFFDFDKSNVTPEANQILSTLYKDAKKAVRAWYHITGHADRSGSDAYNMALSKRRAGEVKAHLMRMGVPAGSISIDFKGEHEPLVQTKDGVREPQNRRAEVRLKVEEVKRK